MRERVRRRHAGRRRAASPDDDQGSARAARGRVRARAGRALRPARARPDRAHLRVIVSTYSIAACDLDAAQWGVAVQSKFLSVGSVVPWAEPQVGAIATQAYANPRYGPDGLALLREGLGAEEVVQRLVDADDGRNERQLGVVDARGNAASYTGSECLDWAGPPHRRLLRGAGQHPRRRRDRRRARDDVRGDGRARPRVAADRLPRGRAACGRRPPRAAVGIAAGRRAGRRLRAAHRRRARPARRRSPAADRGAASASTACMFGLFGMTPREDWLPLDRRPARGGGRAARAARPRLAATRGPASRTSRSGSTATMRSIRSCSRRSATRRRSCVVPVRKCSRQTLTSDWLVAHTFRPTLGSPEIVAPECPTVSLESGRRHNLAAACAAADSNPSRQRRPHCGKSCG